MLETREQIAYAISRRRTGKIEKIFALSRDARVWVKRDPSLFSIERVAVYNYAGYRFRQLVIFLDREGHASSSLKDKLKSGNAIIGRYPVVYRKTGEFAEESSLSDRMKDRLNLQREEEKNQDKYKRLGISISKLILDP